MPESLPPAEGIISLQSTANFFITNLLELIVMSIKLKANERLISVGKYAGEYRYVLTTELYNKLALDKVIEEASSRYGIAKGALRISCDAIGEIFKVWATEGHSIPVPGLGTLRFGVRAKSVANVNEVAAGLITSRRIIFTPTVAIKNELAKTSISITCYDRNGELVKRVLSADDGDVENPEAMNDPDAADASDNPSDSGTGNPNGSGTDSDAGGIDGNDAGGDESNV